jgi:hypothetical protein
MEIIKDILIKAFNFVAIIIAIVFILAMLRAVLMTLKNQSLKVNRYKVSAGSPHHEMLLLSASECEFLNDLIRILAHEFREFSVKVNYDRVPETIHDRKAKEKFKQVCYRISEQLKTTKIPPSSNLYRNLGEVIAFLKKSADSKEPVAEVTLKCKLYLPVGDPLSVTLWEGKVIDKEEYWKEKYRFFHLKEGTHSWLGIELTYKKELLQAPITSKKFKEFLEDKVNKLDGELQQIQLQQISETRKMVDNQPKSSTYNFQGAQFGGGFAADGGTQIGGTLNDFSSCQDLTDAAAKIQALLAQLQRQGMTEEEAQNQAAEDLKTQAKEDPTTLGKLVKWGQSLADTAGKTSVSEAAKVVVTTALRLAGVPLP